MVYTVVLACVCMLQVQKSCIRVSSVYKIVLELVLAFFTDLGWFPEASDSARHPAV